MEKNNSIMYLKIRNRIMSYALDVFQALNKKLEARYMVAGGSIRAAFCGENISDIDLFFCNKYAAEEAQSILEELGFEKTYSTEQAFTYKRKETVIQVITKTYFGEEPLDLLRTFDFTVTCAGLYNKSLYATEEFLLDTAQKKLNLINKEHLEYPIATLVRVLKYQAKGYTIKPLTLIYIALQINSLEIENYQQLKEQLLGMDTLLFSYFFDKKTQENNDLTEIPYVLETFVKEVQDAIETLQEN